MDTKWIFPQLAAQIPSVVWDSSFLVIQTGMRLSYKITALSKEIDHMTTSFWTFRARQTMQLKQLLVPWGSWVKAMSCLGFSCNPGIRAAQHSLGAAGQLLTQANAMWITNTRVQWSPSKDQCPSCLEKVIFQLQSEWPHADFTSKIQSHVLVTASLHTNSKSCV